jgi:hypothetical protein
MVPFAASVRSRSVEPFGMSRYQPRRSSLAPIGSIGVWRWGLEQDDHVKLGRIIANSLHEAATVNGGTLESVGERGPRYLTVTVSMVVTPSNQEYAKGRADDAPPCRTGVEGEAVMAKILPEMKELV